MIPTPEQLAGWRTTVETGAHLTPEEGAALLDALDTTEKAVQSAENDARRARLRAHSAESERDEAQAAIRDARSHARRLIANAQRWESPALRDGTHTLLLTLDGAVTVRGGAIAALADRQRTEGERDRALARIEKVRAVHERVTAYLLDSTGAITETPLVTLCAECSSPDVIECIGDGDYEDGWDNGGREVAYPCATIRALDGEVEA